MKKISLILLSLMLASVLPAMAQSVSVGTQTWECVGALASEAEDGAVKVEITQSKGYAAQKVFMEKGGAYNLSADVRMQKGTEIMQLVVDTGTGTVESIDVGTYVSGEYKTLSGSYIYDGDTQNVQAMVYIRVGNGTKKATYYIKDFKVSSDTKQGNFFADAEKTNKYYEYILKNFFI